MTDKKKYVFKIVIGGGASDVEKKAQLVLDAMLLGDEYKLVSFQFGNSFRDLSIAMLFKLKEKSEVS